MPGGELRIRMGPPPLAVGARAVLALTQSQRHPGAQVAEVKLPVEIFNFYQQENPLKLE